MRARERFEQVLISRIRVSPQNPRPRADAKVDIGELATSIERFGLLQPVVVIDNQDATYDLIIGQRRLLACLSLNWTHIPAIVFEKMNETERLVRSLAENIERRPLPFKTTVQAVERLYAETNSVKEVARLLGLSPRKVTNYLSYSRMPPVLQDMVGKGRVGKADAHRAWIASKADSKKAVEIARRLPRLSKDQKGRLVRLADEKPSASARDLVREASRPVKEVKVTIILPLEYFEKLEAASVRRNLDIETTASQAVIQWLQEHG